MIVTEKIKHTHDFTQELIKARLVADYACQNISFPYNLKTSLIKHIGLKSVIANQILRKYGHNRRLKSVKKVCLVVPAQGIKYKDSSIIITSLKAKFYFQPRYHLVKINQIEVDNNFFHVSYTIPNMEELNTIGSIGVDLNSTGHTVVCAIPNSGKVFKLGKSTSHLRKKTSNLIKKLKPKKKFKQINKIRAKTTRRSRDADHKISRFIVQYALKHKLSIKFEKLAVRRKALHSSTNTWSFRRLQLFTEYKPKMCGIPVYYVNPAYSSQTCSRSGELGKRKGKVFMSPIYGLEDSDVNAAFEIAQRQPLLSGERDSAKGC